MRDKIFFVLFPEYKKSYICIRKRKTCIRGIARMAKGYHFCGMDYYVNKRKQAHCLECGDTIRYGRTDKKFCCDKCKARHYNNLARSGRMFRNKVISMINRNYDILESLLRDGADSVDLVDLISMGFAPGVNTSYRRSGRRDVYTCYDIKYVMTATKVYSITKIKNLSVNLQAETE